MLVKGQKPQNISEMAVLLLLLLFCVCMFFFLFVCFVLFCFVLFCFLTGAMRVSTAFDGLREYFNFASCTLDATTDYHLAPTITICTTRYA